MVFFYLALYRDNFLKERGFFCCRKTDGLEPPVPAIVFG